jgi:hypothetical protein
VRGHLSEFGIVAERGLLGLAELAAIFRDESDQRLPVTARAALMVLVRQNEMVSSEIDALDSTLRKEKKAPVGEYEEAIVCLGKALDLLKGDVQLHYTGHSVIVTRRWLVQALVELGAFDEAIKIGEEGT